MWDSCEWVCGVQVRGQLEVVRSASREVQGSQDFTSLLQAVLALGNHLNEGTHKGNASGALLCSTLPHPLLPHLKPSVLPFLPFPPVHDHACSLYGATSSGTKVLVACVYCLAFLPNTRGAGGGGGAHADLASIAP